MTLAMLSFLIKLSCQSKITIAITAIALAVFIALCGEAASEQSRTQIANWLSQPDLMLDTSVLLTIDVAMQITFCILAVKSLAGEPFTRTHIAIYKIVQWVPGILVFPILFAGLVSIIFACPGIDFNSTALYLGIAIAIIVPLLAFGLNWLILDKETRLELIFLLNGLVAVLGIIATVNGRTTMNGPSEIDWYALLGVIAIVAVGVVAGFFICKRITKHQISKLK